MGSRAYDPGHRTRAPLSALPPTAASVPRVAPLVWSPQSRVEYLSLAGLRVDGRRPRETRRIRCALGLFSQTDGSAYYQQGNTRVLAAVYGPREVRKRSEQVHDKAIIHCEYSTAPFATTERKRRRPGDKKSVEVATAIQRSLETVVLTHLYPRSEIAVFVQVIQSDGGLLAAALNAATLALVDAGVGMRELVVACSSAYLERTPLLDPSYLESSAGPPEATVALLPAHRKITLLELHARVPATVFEEIVDLAMEGCEQVHKVMQAAIREHTLRSLSARGSLKA